MFIVIDVLDNHCLFAGSNLENVSMPSMLSLLVVNQAHKNAAAVFKAFWGYLLTQARLVKSSTVELSVVFSVL